MPVIKIDLDNETFSRLTDLALSERRPIPWQAEILLRQSFGLPFPYDQGEAIEVEAEGECK